MITTELAGNYIILCVLAGVAAAIFLYYRDKRLSEATNGTRFFLAFVRFLGISLLSFLLLNPYLSSKKEQTEYPAIIFLQDNSTSILAHEDSSRFVASYQENFDALKSSFQDNYQFRSFAFGENIQETDDFRFTEKKTDIAAAFRNIDLQFSNQHIGAIVLASDGLYNAGIDPRYALPNINAPIYTIALGDSSRQKDVAISRVLHNNISYLGNDFPLEIKLKADALAGEKALLKVQQKGKTLYKKDIDINKNLYSESIQLFLTADKTGLQEYELSITELNGEKNTDNNYYRLQIDVLDNRRKILILADAPHPDLSAIRAALSKQDEYEVELAYSNTFKSKAEAYNLVILHQLPASAANKNLLDELAKKEIPTWFILGEKSDVSRFNQAQDLVKIRKASGSNETAYADLNKNFDLFVVDEDLRDFIEYAPPLACTFGKYQIATNTHILLRQRIGNVVSDRPMLAFGTFDKRKLAVMSGEGLWRWKLHDYEENNNHKQFEALLGKIVQYLSARDDKSRFKVKTKKQFGETEAIVFEAEVYNSSYEAVNENDVSLEITNENGENFDYFFSPYGNHYKLNAGKLAAGNYTYLAKSEMNGEKMSFKGRFYVRPLQLEWNQTRADHQILYQLSEKTGGQHYPFSDTKKLAQAIQENEKIKPIVYEKWETRSILDSKWLLAALLALFAIEWFVRKRSGSY